MAGFKKKLPMSAAMRPGGFGTVSPGKGGGGDSVKMSAAPKAPVVPKAPSFSAGPKMPGLPKMPKFK